jgi:hypothetical protein
MGVPFTGTDPVASNNTMFENSLHLEKVSISRSVVNCSVTILSEYIGLFNSMMGTLKETAVFIVETPKHTDGRISSKRIVFF